MQKRFKIYRYNPEVDGKPYMQEVTLDNVQRGMMLRDALIKIKELDETFTFRHSCGEGVCGSDAININGMNGLACLTALENGVGRTHIIDGSFPHSLLLEIYTDKGIGTLITRE